MKNILICGEVGVGKSTLVNRLLADCALPRYGFITKIMRTSEEGFREFYLFRASDTERRISEANHLADSRRGERRVNLQLFENEGVEYIREARNDGIIIMDEIGFMESEAPGFCRAVLDALGGEIPVIATVKKGHEHVEFLNSVRNHPGCDIYYIDPDNRDGLYLQLKPVVDSMLSAVTGDGKK